MKTMQEKLTNSALDLCAMGGIATKEALVETRRRLNNVINHTGTDSVDRKALELVRKALKEYQDEH